VELGGGWGWAQNCDFEEYVHAGPTGKLTTPGLNQIRHPNVMLENRPPAAHPILRDAPLRRRLSKIQIGSRRLKVHRHYEWEVLRWEGD
jgi:hypothetical protein